MAGVRRKIMRSASQNRKIQSEFFKVRTTCYPCIYTHWAFWKKKSSTLRFTGIFLYFSISDLPLAGKIIWQNVTCPGNVFSKCYPPEKGAQVNTI